jgi:hypothetical protein
VIAFRRCLDAALLRLYAKKNLIMKEIKMTLYVQTMQEKYNQPEVSDNAEYRTWLSDVEKALGSESRLHGVINTLLTLKKYGDISDRHREIFHLAYFPTNKKAKFFVKWLKVNGYKLVDIWTVRKKRVRVDFSHIGPAILVDLVEHLIPIGTMVKTRGGLYDGWMCSVESDNNAAASNVADEKLLIKNEGKAA